MRMSRMVSWVPLSRHCFRDEFKDTFGHKKRNLFS
jgi:hypothetical protein